MKKTHILLTNDDGIHSEGIKTLWEALDEAQYKTTIAAPLTQQSSKGMASNFQRSIAIRKIAWEKETPAYAIDSTPVDCVKFGLSPSISQSVNLLVSGINEGTNHAQTVLYSGTVGATIEAALQGVPAIAFSSYDHKDTLYAPFKPYIPQIVQFALEHPLPKGTLLNVTFPAREKIEQNGVKGPILATQGVQYWKETDVRIENGEGRLLSELLQCAEAPTTDSYLLQKGYITVVPIQVTQLTNEAYFNSFRNSTCSLSPTLAN